MKHFAIVVGGTIDDKTAIKVLERENVTHTIAADSGMNFFYRVGWKPDYIVGDFDSASCEAMKYFQSQTGIEWETLNPVKDDTDTEHSIRKAIALGADKITLLGATGTRLDHVLGNIELLGIGLKEQVDIQIVDANNRIHLIDHPLVIRKDSQYGKYVSLIPYTEQVSGLTLQGFKYSLENAVLHGFCSLGVSNEIVDEEAEISFTQGILIVIESRD